MTDAITLERAKDIWSGIKRLGPERIQQSINDIYSETQVAIGEEISDALMVLLCNGLAGVRVVAIHPMKVDVWIAFEKFEPVVHDA